MSIQSVFKRYELKYLITNEQKEVLLKAMKPYMKLDKYGKTTIRNIYADTDDFLLIRRSIEKPLYKEKLRIRSYGMTLPDSTVFVELKKKYNHIVYKRRVTLTQKEAENIFKTNALSAENRQISEEINYFLSFYKKLSPKVFLSYDRQAYYSLDGSDFRITFDENVLSRQTDLSLQSDVYGTQLLEEDKVLMEVKCSGGFPLWMTEVLSEQKIYKTSFSKYGAAYKNIIFPQIIEKRNGEVYYD